jgi:hypothetical protein
MPIDKSIPAILTVSSILFGFFFAAFWWILNREVTFKPSERHFKPSTGMLLCSMVMLAVFGIILPLRTLANLDPAVQSSYRGVVLALIGVFGYMLTELGHYSMFQKPKYSTTPEWIWFGFAVVLASALAVKWWIF